ncbi:MAG: TetR/AcrR family transcriptional regulator [Desulfobacterium sp.]|jgi:AcrR family transcriptional regulator|nr:TetR/AcrR family transcriptional regulator [Desulfobacterium sp.]
MTKPEPQKTAPRKPSPPGRTKIMKALAKLLKTKNFHSITTAQIAAQAGVTEGLIYKYFKDKRDLLYEVLNDHFKSFLVGIDRAINDEISSLARLSIIIKTTIESYAANRVFARILLIEVRNNPDYFNCDAYSLVRIYAATILEIIRQGQGNGEINRDVDPYVFRQVILGAIEHACLGQVLFGSTMDTTQVSDEISRILFKGVESL